MCGFVSAGLVKKKSFLFIIAILYTLTGCSDSLPDVISASGTVVFDYSSPDTYPQIRLAVFVETASDARRATQIKAVCRSNNYEWITDNLLVLGSDNRQWTGYTNFVCPTLQSIPSGPYDLYYTDAADRTVQTDFLVSYPEALVTAKAADVLTIMGDNKQELLAANLSDGTLIYYGPRKPEWKTDTDIWNALTLAQTIRVCWTNEKQSVVCMMIPSERPGSGQNTGL
jgi:hypothetical protein